MVSELENDARVYEGLREVGVPVTQSAWPVGKAPALPWIVYDRRRDGEFYAENHLYDVFPRYKAEIYYKERDLDLLMRFERAVEGLGARRLYENTYVNSESCYVLSFTFSLAPYRQEPSYQ